MNLTKEDLKEIIEGNLTPETERMRKLINSDYKTPEDVNKAFKSKIILKRVINEIEELTLLKDLLEEQIANISPVKKEKVVINEATEIEQIVESSIKINEHIDGAENRKIARQKEFNDGLNSGLNIMEVLKNMGVLDKTLPLSEIEEETYKYYENTDIDHTDTDESITARTISYNINSEEFKEAVEKSDLANKDKHPIDFVNTTLISTLIPTVRSKPERNELSFEDEKSSVPVDEMKNLLKETEDYKIVKVLSEMIKTSVDGNLDDIKLSDLQNNLKKLKDEKDKKGLLTAMLVAPKWNSSRTN